mgnify:CR=1 FL=1
MFFFLLVWVVLLLRLWRKVSRETNLSYLRSGLVLKVCLVIMCLASYVLLNTCSTIQHVPCFQHVPCIIIHWTLVQHVPCSVTLQSLMFDESSELFNPSLLYCLLFLPMCLVFLSLSLLVFSLCTATIVLSGPLLLFNL